MLDIRTLFVVIIATSLLLAAAMAAAVGMKFRDGIGKWTGALVLQALTYAFYLSSAYWPEKIALLLPNAAFALCISLQAAAILDFHGKPLTRVWYVLPMVLALVGFVSTANNAPARVIFSCMLFGGGTLALGLLMHRQDGSHNGPARLLVIGGFLVGAFAMFARAIAVLVDSSLARELTTPGYLQGVAFLITDAVILATSVGFLLMHMERAEESARQLAVTDPLTGTFNRRTFLELGAKEIARTRRSKGSLALLMLDLDHFKKVNDQFGHQAGDEALKRVVDVLQGCLRREDLLVRYGGEEFCVLLPDVALDHAALLAERARAAVEAGGFQFQSKRIPVTISVGVALLARDSAEDIERLVGRADEALYSAKASGRNRVVVYPENSTIAMLSRRQRPVAGAEVVAH
ncbi:MAG: GGDEF domain-containing protein [Betaproteobacteria bacterium]